MKIGGIEFCIGSDPEMFIRHKGTKQIVSSIPLIPETKLLTRQCSLMNKLDNWAW